MIQLYGGTILVCFEISHLKKQENLSQLPGSYNETQGEKYGLCEMQNELKF